ncbi:MAG: hypothetical protein AAF607_10160 [Pseudomonadota bacterium]
MTGVITTGSAAKLLWPGLNAIWGREYTEHPLQCNDLFDTFTSTMAYEEDVEMTGFGLAPIKAEGASVTFGGEQQGTTARYTHVAYGYGYIVTREEIDDNLYEARGTQRAQALAFSFRQTKENVAANVYNRAFNSAYPGGDGVELLSTAHPTLDGTQSNELAVAADLSEASLEDLCIQIENAKNSKGLRISLKPQSLHVAPANMFNAERILKSTLRSGTENNDINALKAMNAFPQGIKVNNYFTDPDAFFVRTNTPNGMKMFSRTAAEFTDDSDFATSNLQYKGYERYSFGWTDFRALYGSPGA